MPVEHIGTDDIDILTVTAWELEGSIIDGRGGVDILELAAAVWNWAYDFRSVASLAGIERIRGINSSQRVIFSSEQIQEIRSFENPNRGYFGLTIEGASVDFRHKALVGGIDVDIGSDDAVFTVSDMQAALSVNGSLVTGETLVVESATLTNAERKVLHSRGIDRVKDATGIVTEDLLGPTISGLDSRIAVVPGLRLHPASQVSISEDIGLSSMSVVLEDFSWNVQKLSLDQSGSVRIEYDGGRERVIVDGRTVAELARNPSALHFNFNPEATIADAQAILKAIIYEAATEMPAVPDKLNITLTDWFQNSARAEIGIDYLNYAPTDIYLVSQSIYLNSEGGWNTYLFGIDPNTQERFTYTLLDDANGQFRLQQGDVRAVLSLARPLEPKKSFTIKIRVTDHGGLSFDRTFTLTVDPDSLDSEPDDTLYDEIVEGTGAADILVGTSGDDILQGGEGKDRLTGGAGKDAFVFDTKPSKANIDKITDFSVKNDTILLENAVFTKLGRKSGALKKNHFFKGAKANDKDDYIIYDPKKGALYYDKDGSGGSKAVQIAALKTKLAMTYKDFFVI